MFALRAVLEYVIGQPLSDVVLGAVVGSHIRHDPARSAAHRSESGLSAGANVKAIQRMRGHASAEMTLDRARRQCLPVALLKQLSSA